MMRAKTVTLLKARQYFRKKGASTFESTISFSTDLAQEKLYEVPVINQCK